MGPITGWWGAPAVAGGVRPVVPAGGSEVATARGLAVAPFSAAFSTVTIPAGTSPLAVAVAVAPNGNVYVGNANSANVTEISPLTVTTSPTSPACAQPVTFNISGGLRTGQRW